MGQKIKRYRMMIIWDDGNEYEDDLQAMTFNYDDAETDDGI
ncbi:MAG: hypothetical protein WCJ45_07815 [bacterium]